MPESSIEETTRHAHRKTKGKLEKFLGKFTKHTDINVGIDNEKLDRIFGKGNCKQIGEDIVHKLEHHLETFEIIDYHIAIYARKDFTKTGDALDEGQSIVRAPRPAELWQHSYVTLSLLSSILFAKYVNAVPLYRQEQAFAGSGIEISRENMANWIIKVSDLYLHKYYDVMHEKLQEQKYIHADETPVQVNKEKEPGNKKQYMWVYRTEPLMDGPQIVLYDYRPGRRAEYCGDFLSSFSGTITTDGYEAYHKLARENASRFKVAGCWVYAKRKFMDAVKADKDGKSPPVLAKMAAARISKIFHENNKLGDLPAEERLRKRQSDIKPLVDEFFSWVKSVRESVLPHSSTGEAFTYALNQEPFLRVFLSDPYVTMENSAAERAIRPFTIGRKNWVMIDTPNGAEASAVVYSIVETAKANNLNIYKYLDYLLTELPKYIHDLETKIPEKLFPWSPDFPAELRK